MTLSLGNSETERILTYPFPSLLPIGLCLMLKYSRESILPSSASAIGSETRLFYKERAFRDLNPSICPNLESLFLFRVSLSKEPRSLNFLMPSKESRFVDSRFKNLRFWRVAFSRAMFSTSVMLLWHNTRVYKAGKAGSTLNIVFQLLPVLISIRQVSLQNRFTGEWTILSDENIT